MKPMRPRFVLASVDDGEALYFNGKLVAQNSSIRARDVLQALEDEDILYWSAVTADTEAIQDRGGFPEDLDEL